VAQTADSGRDAVIANETLAGEDTENAAGPNPGNSQELRPSEVNRECLRLVHLAGLEPATFGSVDRCSIQLSYRCEGTLPHGLVDFLPVEQEEDSVNHTSPEGCVKPPKFRRARQRLPADSRRSRPARSGWAAS